MPIPESTELHRPGAWHVFFLWAGVLLGPLVWLSLLTISYAWVASGCAEARRGPMLLLMLGGLAGTLLAGGLAWNERGRALRAEPPLEGREPKRALFMAQCGLMLSGFSAVLVIATAVPV